MGARAALCRVSRAPPAARVHMLRAFAWIPRDRTRATRGEAVMSAVVSQMSVTVSVVRAQRVRSPQGSFSRSAGRGAQGWGRGRSHTTRPPAHVCSRPGVGGERRGGFRRAQAMLCVWAWVRIGSISITVPRLLPLGVGQWHEPGSDRWQAVGADARAAREIGLRFCNAYVCGSSVIRLSSLSCHTTNDNALLLFGFVCCCTYGFTYMLPFVYSCYSSLALLFRNCHTHP